MLLQHLGRPITTLAGLVLVASCAATGCIRQEQARDASNVVLISLNSVRADHLRLYGYQRPTTVILDQIAKNSVVFDMAIAQAPSTTASIRSLITSRYASMAGKQAATLAEVLKQAGYQTAAFTGPSVIATRSGADRGFDLFVQGDPSAAPYSKSKNLHSDLPKIKSWTRDHKDEPFFASIHVDDTSSPYGAPPGRFERLFCGNYQGSLFGPAADQFLVDFRQRRRAGATTAVAAVSSEEKRQITALYDGGIFYVDSLLGQLQKHLEELGVWDRTMLVILSDHGEELWDHESVLHGITLYQEIVRVPLVIRLPGDRNGGQRIDEPVTLLDVAPTILEVLGVPPVSSHQGHGLMARITGTAPRRSFTVASESRSQRALLRWPSKLIINNDSGAIELYDLEEDPGELFDLAAGKGDEALAIAREMALQVPKLGPLAARHIDEITANVEGATAPEAGDDP